MKPIAILQHSVEAPPGYLGEAIARAGVPSFIVRLHEGNQLPGLEKIGALVSLGGSMGAYDEHKYSFLVLEKDLLRAAVAAAVPVLGICLGCQMLADALGGSAYPASEMEVQFAALELSPEAATDPILGTLAEPVLSFHEDTWDPPPGATIVAWSDRFPQAFRLGSAVAIQPHPEVSAAMVGSWVDGFGKAKLEESGIDAAEVLRQMAVGDEAGRARALRMFAAWLDEVVAADSYS